MVVFRHSTGNTKDLKLCGTCAGNLNKQQSWKERDECECPVSSDYLPSNLVLRHNLVKERQVRAVTASQSECPDHKQKQQFFFLDDKQLVCLQCVAEGHQNHDSCSIIKAAKDCKEELSTSQKHADKLLDTFKNFKTTCEKIVKHIQQTEEEIKEEFERLQFLRHEEEIRITALREEEKEKGQRMKEKIAQAEEECNVLVQLIQEIEAKMEAEDVMFLQVGCYCVLLCSFKRFQNEILIYNSFSLDLSRSKYTVPDPAVGPGVCEKVRDICPYYPVTLDPNITSRTISISPDPSSLMGQGTTQDLPNTPERFSIYPIVLGSEGFDSGMHSWLIEVKQCVEWIIVVSKGSVKRKKNLKSISC
ncbi:E3 ubiquitin-protein ligase TRIM39-like [Electrophorus electricus]|uniref:E3 ubiquitin-protein ligase TRIM39-like n=1 Tax=Electrophorus electricus TaxID=8005 RepID=UPI0015D0A642|nr:E3 ubiquitin-protein ligase TRIM39-like [Electrophorus electricus]